MSSERPLRVLGGTGRSDPRTVEFLARAGAGFVVDGYNVSMQGWPALAIDRQRDALVDRLDDIANRTGAAVTVVFDGAAVDGGHSRRRRRVRVRYSSPGETADDAIVEQVASDIDRTPVAVVTDDVHLQRRVRRLGANVVSPTALLAR
jgi:predicted RNA-binding protein with PIN domain